jgi:hypothetical protein
MPVIGVNRAKLFERLGQEYEQFSAPPLQCAPCAAPKRGETLKPNKSLVCAADAQMDQAEEHFNDLCFKYGIELDDVVRSIVL